MIAQQQLRLPGMPPQECTSDDYYTPRKYIESARNTLMEIELDPASCEYAQRAIQAERYYTVEDDGLALPWRGTVWLNPPYSDITPWAEKLVAAYESGDVHAAVMLVPPYTNTPWFQMMLEYPMCMTDHRIRFENPSKKMSSPTFGNVFFYLPADGTGDYFYDEFAQYGTVGKLARP